MLFLLIHQLVISWKIWRSHFADESSKACLFNEMFQIYQHIVGVTAEIRILIWGVVDSLLYIIFYRPSMIFYIENYWTSFFFKILVCFLLKSIIGVKILKLRNRVTLILYFLRRNWVFPDFFLFHKKYNIKILISIEKYWLVFTWKKKK